MVKQNSDSIRFNPIENCVHCAQIEKHMHEWGRQKKNEETKTKDDYILIFIQLIFFINLENVAMHFVKFISSPFSNHKRTDFHHFLFINCYWFLFCVWKKKKSRSLKTNINLMLNFRQFQAFFCLRSFKMLKAGISVFQRQLCKSIISFKLKINLFWER